MPMQPARYHRERAELCLEIAGHMSDRQAADVLRTAAGRHFEQAIELEKGPTVSDRPAEVKP
jgi:hypothetical protein